MISLASEVIRYAKNALTLLCSCICARQSRPSKDHESSFVLNVEAQTACHDIGTAIQFCGFTLVAILRRIAG